MLTQIALHGAGMVRGGVQRHDGGVQPGGAAPVHQLPAANQGSVLVTRTSIVKLCTNHSAVLLLPVDHGGLAGHGAVEVDHGDSLLIGPDHARLHHLHSQSQVSIIVSFNQSEPSITCPDTSSSNTKADTFSSSSGWILAK